MDTDVPYIQTGWNVRSSDGQELGTVIELTHDSMILRDDGGRRRTVPKAYIDEEDEVAELAILSKEAQDLDEDSGSS